MAKRTLADIGEYLRPKEEYKDNWANNLVLQVVDYSEGFYTVKIVEIERTINIGVEESIDQHEMDMLEIAHDYEATKQFDSDLEELLNAKE